MKKNFRYHRKKEKITGIVRVTIEALQMNNDLIVNLRSLWSLLGLHPAD